MVEEVLVRETLSPQEITCGEELIRRIERDGMTVVAAYWVRDRTAETNFWTLTIVSPQVDKEGPLSIYARIQKLITSPTRIGCGIDLNIITVSGIDYSFYNQLQAAIRSRAKLNNIALSQLVVGNTLVDLFVYRFPATNGRHR